jgi:hypothetical protein
MESQLDQAFAAVTAAKGDVKRRGIAHLLFCLCDVLRVEEDPQKPPELFESKAYQRYLAVVGLDAAVHEVDGQSAMLWQVGKDVREGMLQDLDAFAVASKRQLQQIEYLSERVDQQKEYLKQQKELVTAKQELVKERRLQVDQLEKELKEAQDFTRDRLKEQAAMEKALFESRQRLRDAYEKNQQLEQNLRDLEKGR